MEQNAWFFRAFFLLFSCFAAVAYEHSISESNETFLASLFKGISLSLVIFTTLIVIERRLKKYSLRTINTAFVGLFIGSLMGSAVVFSIQSLISVVHPSFEMATSLMLVAFFASVYLGVMLTSTTAERWWLTIPFVRLAPAEQRKTREIIVDLAAIEDTRLIELARTGLLDHLLVVPTFIVKEIQKSLESVDEIARTRGRKCHEHLKRLECLPQLGLTIKEFHFHDQEDLATRLNRAAKLTQAYILTSQDVFSLRSEEDYVTTINLETISIALKPGAQRGESLSIKIQRLGKEPKQGVGYLEDGTMVVVNGGGEHLGQTIRTQVLSQKYSSSGKIIFCNALTSDDKKNGAHDGSSYSQLLSTVL